MLTQEGAGFRTGVRACRKEEGQLTELLMQVDWEGVADRGLLEGALAVLRRLQSHGHESYFAGGAVRDLLLRHEITDIDIATSARPEEVESLFDRTIPVGKQFGVVIVALENHHYEVTTFRQDSGYSDGRHPDSVRFSGSREDAMRRDFTVNALLLEPFERKVIDFVGGLVDLRAGILRTVGDPAARFAEDKLRVLRAIRFACQLGFEIDAGTWEQVRSFAGRLSQVSWERIREEVARVLTGPRPAAGLQLLQDSGILGVVLPEASAMVGVEQPPQFHPEGDVFTHTRLMFELADPPLPLTLAFGILLHDVGKPPTFTISDRIRFHGHAEVGAEMAETICRRLRLSGEQTERVRELVQHHLRFIHVEEMRESTLKRFLRLPGFEQHLELHRLDCMASHGDLSSYRFCVAKLKELKQEDIRPAALLNGRDLIQLGLVPGPLFSEILSQLEDLQLEKTIRTRAEAMQWVQDNYCRPS